MYILHIAVVVYEFLNISLILVIKKRVEQNEMKWNKINLTKNMLNFFITIPFQMSFKVNKIYSMNLFRYHVARLCGMRLPGENERSKNSFQNEMR